MTDENAALRTVDRASRASALLNDPVLIEAFALIDSELVTRWKASKDPVARDRIWQASNIATWVQEILRTAITNGKVAKADLAAIDSKRSRAKAA